MIRHPWNWTCLAVGLLTLGGCGRNSAKGGGETPAKSAPVTFPELGAVRQIQPGINFAEATVNRGGVPMRVWYYEPANLPKDKLPLVVVPPAGSPLFVGMNLGDGDRPEHLPYVKAGFAVVSFEIDGHVANMQQAKDAEIFRAARAFKDANAGIVNATTALDFILAKNPKIDPDRIYTAGHSSAATLALQFAANDKRVKGCAAYAPVTDLRGRLAPALNDLNRSIAGFGNFVDAVSPLNQSAKLTCPVFLFHSTADDNVKSSETTNFAAALKKSNSNVTVSMTPRGDHHSSMMAEGIPQGIAWMKKLP